MEFEHIATVVPKILWTALTSVYHMAYDSEFYSYPINSVLLKMEGKDLVTVATDSHILAEFSKELNVSGQVYGEWILPISSVKILVEILSINNDLDLVDISSDGEFIRFFHPKFDYRFPIIREEYPDYEQSFPLSVDKIKLESGIIGISFKYMYLIDKVVTELLGDKKSIMKFHFYGETSPIVIEFPKDIGLDYRYTIILMPCRLV